MRKLSADVFDQIKLLKGNPAETAGINDRERENIKN